MAHYLDLRMAAYIAILDNDFKEEVITFLDMYRKNKKEGKFSNTKIHNLMQMLSDWGNLKRKSRKGNLIDDKNAEEYFYKIARNKPTKIDKHMVGTQPGILKICGH